MSLNPPAVEYRPGWLSPEDVRRWLRLNGEDSSDDDLLLAVSAMAEPYVMRCRPEWCVPGGTPTTRGAQYGPVPVTVDTVANTAQLGQYLADNPLAPVPDDRSTYTYSFQLAPGQTIAPALPWQVNTGARAVPVMLDELGTTPATGAQLQQIIAGQLMVQLTPGLVGTAFLWAGAVMPQFTGRTGYSPDAETYRGAVMYAAREYRRRNSPAGIEAFGEVTSFVTRFDPDIDRALQTGSFARPVVS